MTRRCARGVGAQPLAHLLRLHHHSLSNVLVLGGTEIDRLTVARAFHLASPLRRGPFLHLDCSREESRLERALQLWVFPGDVRPGANPLHGIERGTLFLDSIAKLAMPVQRLMLMLVRNLESGSWDSRSGLGPFRLAAGNPEDLAGTVARRSFSDALYDCLDKIRVDLGGTQARGAA